MAIAIGFGMMSIGVGACFAVWRHDRRTERITRMCADAGVQRWPGERNRDLLSRYSAKMRGLWWLR